MQQTNQVTATSSTCLMPVEKKDRLYASCATCHGQSGGTGPTAAAVKSRSASLSPAPPAVPANVNDSHSYHSIPVAAAPRQRRPWSRQKLFIVPLLLVMLAGAGTRGVMVYFNEQFSQVNTISPPPPELDSDRLGGKEGAMIDTSAAQDAVRNAREGESSRVGADGHGSGGGSDEASDGNVVDVQGSQGPSAVIPPDSDRSQPSLPWSSDDSVTILLMGVDARPGEAIDVGVRPDTLAVLHLDSETGSCRMLSIPRDTRTELPGYGLSKVNHALAVGGVPYQILVTQRLLGIEIDHYGLIDFSGITELVDAVGGVTVINEEAFTISSTHFDEGAITLNGGEALAFARYRGGSDSDFGRMDRQQRVVRALISQTSSMDIITGAYNLFGAVEGHVKTDLSIIELIGLATDYHSTCTETTLEFDTLDGTVATFPDSLLNMELSYVIVDPAEVRRTVDWLFGG